MREQLYLAILKVAKRVEDYFNAKLGAYYVEQNHKYADAFLKKFRDGKTHWWEHWSPNPETWARKPKSNPFCKHLKGGKSRAKFTVKDYNVAAHIFVDGTMKIWCLNNCGFVSHPGDSTWELATQMLKSSSNKMSTTEHFIPAQTAPAVTVTVQDSVPDGRS